MDQHPALILDGSALTLKDFADVVHRRRPVALDPEAIHRMEASRRMVEQLVQKERIIYGITTGFGKFSDTVISRHQSAELQLNLIRSHACGVGTPLSEEVVRGMILLRANALAKGFSGVRPVVVQRLIDLLNKGIHPHIPSQGSLGASGDLAPLAHMALPLLGEGEVWYTGKRMAAAQALRLAGLEPIELAAKEGLALINGTQLMTSLTALALIASERLLLSADIIGAMTLEALGGIPQAFHPLLQKVRGHQGQIASADNLRSLIQESSLVNGPGPQRVQDAYSLRCMPQVHGASKDAFHYVKDVILREMNAATDNPLLFPEENLVVSGGNFHGQPIALAADFLAIALAELANISERRTERLVNPHLSGLPPFLTRRGGLHSGYMILQYVAASLVSENKPLCHPASVDSIPSSANQEDHVSMGAIGARKLQSVVHNVTRVLAIEYLCAAQALEFAKASFGVGTRIAYRLLRERVSPLEGDREGTVDIEEAARLIEQGPLVRAVAEAVPLSL